MELLEGGQYLEAIRCAGADTLLSTSSETLEGFYERIEERVSVELNDVEKRGKMQMDVLAMAVASLYTFLHSNFLGSSDGCFPPEYVSDLRNGSKDRDDSTLAQDRKWLREKMCVDGEERIGKLRGPQYLLLAQVLLVPRRQDGKLSTFCLREELDLPTAVLWAARVLFTGQRILTRGAASYKDAVISYYGLAVERFSEASFCVPDLDRRTLLATSLVELSAAQKYYGDVKAADESLQRAMHVLGLNIDVIGVMGKRTVHQVDSTAQLFVSANRTDPEGGACRSWSDDDEDSTIVFSQGLGDDPDCNVLERPKLDTERPLIRLHQIEQAVILEKGLLLKSQMAKDELQEWQVSPYLDIISSQKSSCIPVQVVCELNRARHESSRGRTRERALLRLERLEETLRSGRISSPAALCLYFGVSPPFLVEIQKELAEAYVAAGLLKDALRIYENLELWNSLIACYTLLGKKVQCEALIKQRLEKEPDDPQLWCALGDISLDWKHYQTAWERSSFRSVRSQRSLARHFLKEKCYTEAVVHYENALHLNPIVSDDWFSLGYCYLKLGNDNKALTAFSRCTQLDPEQGEAWNNVAALNVRKERYKEAFVALTEALKQRRRNWQTWANYVQVAAHLGYWMQVLSGSFQLLELTDGQVFPLESVQKLLTQFDRDRQTESTMPDHDREKLLEGLGKLLGSAAEKGAGGRTLWKAYAKFFEVSGNHQSARDCLVKYIRALQSSNWTADEEGFRELTEASLDLCRGCMDVALAGKSKKGDLSMARLHLRSLLKLAAEQYADHPEYQKLEEMYRRLEGMDAT